jgi:hypothetical protein
MYVSYVYLNNNLFFLFQCLRVRVLKPPTMETYLITYLLTPWSIVLLEKLTVNFAASQEIPRIERKHLYMGNS